MQNPSRFVFLAKPSYCNKIISIESRIPSHRYARVRSVNESVRKNGSILPIIFLLVIMTVSSSSVSAYAQISFPAVADAYVDNANPNANFGSSLFLYAHNYSESVGQASAGSGTQNEVGPIVRSWLKFDLSQIPSQATIRSATLRIHTSVWGTRSVNKIGVFVCEDNSWTESAITWSNAPSGLSSNSLDTLECANPDVDYTFDVTLAMKEKRSFSLVLETIELSKEPAVFNSKDLNPDTGPTLVVEYDLPLDLGVIGAFGLLAAVLGAFVVALIIRSKKRVQKLPIFSKGSKW